MQEALACIDCYITVNCFDLKLRYFDCSCRGLVVVECIARGSCLHSNHAVGLDKLMDNYDPASLGSQGYDKLARLMVAIELA